MKRRHFFQYVGLGSIGFSFALQRQSQASSPVVPLADLEKKVELRTFNFDTTTLDQSGRIKQVKTGTASFFREPINLVEHLEMVAIAPGHFLMGSSSTELHRKENDLLHHRVNVDSFFISKYPVTQSQWAAVALLPQVQRSLEPFPSHFQGRVGAASHGGDRPVENVSWVDAMEFCARLNQATGRRYQLPSETQWEYACRAGVQTPFSTGETITSQFANYVGTYTYKAEMSGTYRRATVPVGSFEPNAFGLYDMHGNVWEWCADRWHPLTQASVSGQSGLATRSVQMRAIRGGSWLDAPGTLRAGSRSGYDQVGSNRTIGFRVITT